MIKYVTKATVIFHVWNNISRESWCLLAFIHDWIYENVNGVNDLRQIAHISVWFHNF